MEVDVIKDDIIASRWNSKTVVGDIKTVKPGFIAFRNTEKASRILYRHINRNSRIAVHCDVDVDGIGSGYIMKSMLSSLGATNILFTINKEREHGIQYKYVEYFNNRNKCDLLIILDSSTNELDIIKQFNCDVIVLDHHEVLHEDTHGYVNNGNNEYVIVNNMLDNTGTYIEETIKWINENNSNIVVGEQIGEYISDSNMSCGLVIYEFMRLYCKVYKHGNIPENLMLYQWVGVTLFSDSILLASDRNQWYIENTVHSFEVEVSLKIMMGELNKYQHYLGKSFLIYTFIPTINRAIRAGAGGEALDIVLNKPNSIDTLGKYRDVQDEIISKYKNINLDRFASKDYIMIEVDKELSNYCGLIGSGLCGNNDKNTVVYSIKSVGGDDNREIAKGSFRGRRSDADYRKFFSDYKEGIYAQGHKVAFGFEVEVNLLKEIMENIHKIEFTNKKLYLTAGQVEDEFKGKHHIDDMLEFKQKGYFWKLAVANSKLCVSEQLDIVASIRDIESSRQIGKLYLYNIFDIECKAFEIIKTDLIKIYLEYNRNGIEAYVKNFEG